MRRPVVWGAGAGLLVVVVATAVWWKLASPPALQAVPAHRPAAAQATSGAASIAGVTSPSVAAGNASSRDPGEAKERRRRIAEVRAELAALRAQGMQASPEKLRALVDELEAISPPGFDPRYFSTLRSMLESSARVQALSAELDGLSKRTTPQDAARREAILAEMKILGERVSADARDLQRYVPMQAPAASGARTP